ncbi:uncharacterized protein LOC119076154 [Bradysia coprophila]|uniref:uncharacterized protein LOC119076154 n=1 Tax=Bradysia coprophila TaxID=38358 RepID=UPI00187DACF1|nr:uncharacterized protein LOC119076154 [Bradysia coprophila]
MNKLFVAFFLGFFVAVSSEGLVSNVVKGLTCAFPNKGSGGILGNAEAYINDAAFAWIDVARNTIPYVNDPRGTEALTTWIDASLKFNIAMIAGDQDEAFRLFDVCNESFKSLAPYLSKPELSTFYLKIYDEFGAVIKTRNLKEINEYMVAAYPQFREAIGCKVNEGGLPLPLNPLNSLNI